VKTVEQWLNELPGKYATIAIFQMVPQTRRRMVDSMQMALGYGLKWWINTPQGAKFWLDVYRHFQKGTPLPEIPKNKKKH